MSWHLKCEVNGRRVEGDVPEDSTLLSFLRDDLGLTGTKGACLEGECGSCTVLLDDRPVCSCLVLVPQVHGRRIRTVESLADGDELHRLQKAFIQTGAAQCGYCTPGLLMAAAALLEANPDPTEDEVRRGLEGNLCRCTGYTSILEAVRIAAREQRR
jgi:carbon-monoxide dehydrogenase small subunit